MLRIDKDKKSLVVLQRTTMKECGYWERRDIQDMICRTPDAFCEELGEQIWIVGEEVEPADFVRDRIDLLGVDPNGDAVIVEIKRDAHKLQLLQALAYAGMIAKWEPRRFIEALQGFNSAHGSAQSFEVAKEELEEVLDDGDVEIINRSQRIILLSEGFDYEVLVTAEWLTERYDVDIRCYRIALSKHDADELLTCTRAYPPPELTDLAIRRRQKKETGAAPAPDWDAALKPVENLAVRQFFREELDAARSNNPKYKALRFFIGSRRRFTAQAKRKYARVWQQGRFEDDVEFWKSRLGAQSDVAPKDGGAKLRFLLFNVDDFSKFKRAVTEELINTEFHGSSEEEQEEAGFADDS